MRWPFKKKQKVIHRSIAKAAHTSQKRQAGFVKEKVNAKEFKEWSKSGTKQLNLGENVLIDKAGFYKMFFAMVTRYYPAASAARWFWKNLCATPQKVKFEGGTDTQKKEAKQRVNQLDLRLTPIKTVKGGGMDMLIAQFFHYIFTYGRFSGFIIPDRSFSRIEKFQITDPFNTKFLDNIDRTAYVSKNGFEFYPANDKTFFYYGLNMDYDNPYGVALLESAWSVMAMAEEMLEDMRLSSSNAGLPRLHIKITQPDKDDSEDHEDYIDRISDYFDSYVSELSDIAPDDNFYSWDDVQIGVVGGHKGAGGFIWRNNHQVLDEEIISAFHLYPWIVGKSSQTTKNWVKSQFDLLMAEVTSIQRNAKRFAEWIRNTDLMLGGITDVRSIHTFDLPRDPSRKDTAIAERFEIENSERKVLNGVISPDTGAMELGYDKAYKPNLVYAKDKAIGAAKKPEHKDSRDNNTVDIIETRFEEIEEKIDSLTDNTDKLLSCIENSENDNSNPFEKEGK